MPKLSQDKVLDVLKGSGAKRPARHGATIDVHYRPDGSYTVQLNGKQVEEGAGTVTSAAQAAVLRADRVRKLTGKPVSVRFHKG